MLDIIKKQRRFFKKSRERYQNLTEEEKNKKRKYGRERYKDHSKTEKQRLVE